MLAFSNFESPSSGRNHSGRTSVSPPREDEGAEGDGSPPIHQLLIRLYGCNRFLLIIPEIQTSFVRHCKYFHNHFHSIIHSRSVCFSAINRLIDAGTNQFSSGATSIDLRSGFAHCRLVRFSQRPLLKNYIARPRRIPILR